ncbi:MAG: chloride channel protein [Acidimicrobiales bacterium]
MPRVNDDAGSQRWAVDLGHLIGRIREARHRSLGLGLAAVVGAVVGLVLAGAETLIDDGMLTPLRDAPLAVQLVTPAIGLLVIWAVLRLLAGGASPFIADDYLKSYHDPDHPIDLRAAPGRVLAGVLTLGSGAAMGAEALGIYVGASVATIAGSRLVRDRGRVLLVAGAAAGVSAVFKAPATGAVFALEVPYMQDMAGGAVLPALVGAATAYLAVALTQGTSAILTIGANPQFEWPELLGAIAVGAACGMGARLFVTLMGRGKTWVLARGPAGRIIPAGIALGAFVAISDRLYHHPFTLGAGYDVITWATDPHRGLWLVAGLFVLRIVATAGTQWGGGAGGSFVPLVVQGALLGRLVQGGLNEMGAATSGNLFILVGMAAFLGAGYHVPLAAVMFVAETTGKPGFIVPGLLACAVADLVMGHKPASPLQHATRAD